MTGNDKFFSHQKFPKNFSTKISLIKFKFYEYLSTAHRSNLIKKFLSDAKKNFSSKELIMLKMTQTLN